MTKFLTLGKTILVFSDKSSVTVNWGILQYFAFTVCTAIGLTILFITIGGLIQTISQYSSKRANQKAFEEDIKGIKDIREEI